MVGEEVLSMLPEEVLKRVENLITLFQAVGILAILYILWMGVRGFLTMKTYKKVDTISNDIKKIKKKLKIRN